MAEQFLHRARSAPASNIWVANVWRNVCGLTLCLRSSRIHQESMILRTLRSLSRVPRLVQE